MRFIKLIKDIEATYQCPIEGKTVTKTVYAGTPCRVVREEPLRVNYWYNGAEADFDLTPVSCVAVEGIEIGPQEGTHYRQRWFDKVFCVAVDIQEKCPALTNLKVWYEQREDYMKIGFTRDGVNYWIQHYKVWALYQEGDGMARWYWQGHDHPSDIPWDLNLSKPWAKRDTL